MRQFKSTDLFKALRVVKAVGVKEEMKEFAQRFADGKISAKTQRELGVELMLGILSNCGNEAAEMAFFDFLSGPMETGVAELRDMDLLDFMEQIKAFMEFIDVEAWKAFFSSLADLIQKMK